MKILQRSSLIVVLIILGLGTAAYLLFSSPPLEKTVKTIEHPVSHLKFRLVDSIAELQQQILLAKRQQNPLMLEFHTQNCISCEQLENVVLATPDIKRLLDQFVLVEADISSNTEQHQALMRLFEVNHAPAIIFFYPTGIEARHHRVIDHVSPEDFLSNLNAFIDELPKK